MSFQDAIILLKQISSCHLEILHVFLWSIHPKPVSQSLLIVFWLADDESIVHIQSSLAFHVAKNLSLNVLFSLYYADINHKYPIPKSLHEKRLKTTCPSIYQKLACDTKAYMCIFKTHINILNPLQQEPNIAISCILHII